MQHAPASMRVIMLSVAAALLGGAGCAFTDVQLDMPISGLAAPLKGGNGRQVIVAMPFVDQRAQPHRCGMQKNGYNMDTANVVCRSDPTQWIAQLLADELRASGFAVVAADGPRKATALRLEGNLLQLFVEPLAGTFSVSCEADLQVRLVATSETGLRAERTFMAKGVWKGFAGIDTPFHDSFKKASDQVVAAMVEAVLELLNRYPQLGARSRRPRIARTGIACAG
jgi:hypothetical protein